ncbi:hypothetical protein GINT2_001830 [Glugoides intestinalis]
MRFSSILIASTLISCNISTEEKLEELKSLYEKMPTDETNLDDFAKRVDSTLKNVPLEDLAVFNKFALFLLHSEKHNYMLKGMDLRLVYRSENENLKKHWKNHANKKLGSLRFSFNIAEINKDNLLKEKIEFCSKFSNLTKVKLFYESVDVFDESVIWNNLMEVLSNLKEISKCTELELNTNNLNVLKYIIDGATSKSEALQQLKKLKIVFNSLDGIYYLDSALENFSSLVTSLQNLSKITIENQATAYIERDEDPIPDNLVNLIKGLPENRSIAIKLIGKNINLNEEPKLANEIKKIRCDVNVSIVYKLDAFNNHFAHNLRTLIEHSKLDIRIFGTSNRIKRHLPITTEILDNLLKVKSFHILFDSKEIQVQHTNVEDFISSFGPFFQEWKLLRYKDNSPRTEIRKLLEFVETFNKCKSISFESNFLEISNECALDSIISEVVNKRDKELVLETSALLIDSENFIPFYKKMQGNENFTLKANLWLIRVRNENMGAFILQLPKPYNMEFYEIRQKEEFLEKINALSKLDCFKPDVLYIKDGRFDHVFRMLPTIKNMFEKVIVAKKAFTEDQIEKLREELGNEGSCTLETLTDCTLETMLKESLLNSWLRRQ